MKVTILDKFNQTLVFEPLRIHYEPGFLMLDMSEFETIGFTNTFIMKIFITNTLEDTKSIASAREQSKTPTPTPLPEPVEAKALDTLVGEGGKEK